MTRKRFKKLMMSMGLHKNNVNNYNPFTAWPFCVTPSICNYDYVWQLYKPIFKLAADIEKYIQKQINDGISFTYKGYFTHIEYDKKDKIFYGKLENINDMINFHTGNYMEIENEFHNAVDDYLDFCKEVGKEPEKPNV